MKMNKLVKGLLVGFIALQMVGCEEAKEVENLNIQDTNPVVEEVENEYCDNCGNRLDYCECNEEPQVEDELYYDCIQCGKRHTEADSYYNEDGMSACSKLCYYNYLDDMEEIYGRPEVVHEFQCLTCKGFYTEEKMFNATECQDCYNRWLENATYNDTPAELNARNTCIKCGSDRLDYLGEGSDFSHHCHDCGINFNL